MLNEEDDGTGKSYMAMGWGGPSVKEGMRLKRRRLYTVEQTKAK